jgi:putative oxidoreductase
MLRRSFSTAVNAGAVNFWLLISRVAIGAMMFSHGWPKFQKLMAGGEIQFADPFGIGPAASLALTVFAEAACSLLLVFGLATRLATIPLIITMLVAIFYAHAGDPFGKKEMAVIYLLMYIGILILGAGKYSVDHAIAGKGGKR